MPVFAVIALIWMAIFYPLAFTVSFYLAYCAAAAVWFLYGSIARVARTGGPAMVPRGVLVLYLQLANAVQFGTIIAMVLHLFEDCGPCSGNATLGRIIALSLTCGFAVAMPVAHFILWGCFLRDRSLHAGPAA